MMSQAVVARAAALSSASLHEAAGKVGALPSSLRPIDMRRPLCGRAFPVSCPAGDNLFLHHAIYAAEPGDVLVVHTQGGREFGYWGEIMARAAQVRGLAGLVITGGVRDSQRMVEMGFPVFSETLCIRGTGKNPMGPGRVGEPVRIGDVDVRPGDLVFGDADGLVILPADQADAACALAEQRDAAETDILRRLETGETTLSIYHLPTPCDERPSPPPNRRRSVHVDGLAHGKLPIPTASRVAGMIATGGIRGVDRDTGRLPDTAEAQARQMFDNLRDTVRAAGGDVGDIVKVTIWLSDPADRPLVNPPWEALFPDPDARPARHILIQPLPGDMLIQCEALAVTGDA